MFDWRRGSVFIADPTDDEWQSLKPVTIYRARITNETIVNAMQRIGKTGKPVRGAWTWTIIHISPIAVHVDGGSEGTLVAAKRRAEFAARPFTTQGTLWSEEDAGEASGDTGAEFSGPLLF